MCVYMLHLCMLLRVCAGGGVQDTCRCNKRWRDLRWFLVPARTVHRAREPGICVGRAADIWCVCGGAGDLACCVCPLFVLQLLFIRVCVLYLLNISYLDKAGIGRSDGAAMCDTCHSVCVLPC